MRKHTKHLDYGSKKRHLKVNYSYKYAMGYNFRAGRKQAKTNLHMMTHR